MDVRGFRVGKTLWKVGLAEFVHEESDRAEIHAVNGDVAAYKGVKRLEHQAIATERDNGRRIFWSRVVIDLTKSDQHGLRFGRFRSHEMEFVGHGRISRRSATSAGRQPADCAAGR